MKATVVLAFVVFLAFAFGAHAERQVTMNLAFSIGPHGSDTLSNSSGFSSASYGGHVIGISGGTDFNGTVNASYSSTAEMISLTSQSENELGLAFTSGNSSTIHSGVAVSRFGTLALAQPQTFPLYIVLEYFGLDITSNAVMSGDGKITVRNSGTGPLGPLISVVAGR